MEKKKKGEAKPKKKDKYETQLKWIFIGMGILILIILIVLYIKGSMNRFEYGGFEFEKIMYDKLQLYYSKIPVMNSAGQTVANYNLYLRNDPRTLRNIPINGTIRLTVKSIVSIDESMEGCSDNGIAGVTLGTFFKAAGINAVYASTDKTIAEERNISYATCEDKSEYTVIVIKRADENSIIKENEKCYSINFKDCDIIKAVERFIVATSAHSKGIEV